MHPVTYFYPYALLPGPDDLQMNGKFQMVVFVNGKCRIMSYLAGRCHRYGGQTCHIFLPRGSWRLFPSPSEPKHRWLVE